MRARVGNRALRGEIEAIASKSDAHRALIAAALCDAPARLAMNASSDDIEATCACLRAMGARIERDGGDVCVHPMPGRVCRAVLDCGESGSTLRFLLPVAAARVERARFEGRGRLPERPLGPLINCLSAHGARFSGERLPVEAAGGLRGGPFEIAGDVSSQYISGLLFALPLVDAPRVVSLTRPLVSAGYVDMTVDTLSRFGVQVRRQGGRFEVDANARYASPGRVAIEGDWSNAAFFLSAGALGGDVTVRGLNARSNQRDRAIARLLCAFGARVECGPDWVRARPGNLRGIRADMGDIPDLAPVLAAVAAAAQGETRLVNAARLRLKESDRISSTARMLRAVGARVRETEDELWIQGGARLSGGRVDGQNDHRIVMAASVLALACLGPVEISGAEAVRKSYPAFFEDYSKLGGEAHVLIDG